MSINYEKWVKRDIEKYKQTGKLPRDWDVRETRKTGTYWDWVEKKNGGLEPIENSPYLSDKESFRKWQDNPILEYLNELMPEIRENLTEKQLEIFDLVYTKGMTEREIATILMVSHQAVNAMVERINTVIKEVYIKAQDK